MSGESDWFGRLHFLWSEFRLAPQPKSRPLSLVRTCSPPVRPVGGASGFSVYLPQMYDKQGDDQEGAPSLNGIGPLAVVICACKMTRL